jgi:hypothetical protein
MADLVAGRYELGGMVSYQGKDDCRIATCRRRWDGDQMVDEGCADYHCPVCHEPCSMYGHKACTGTVAEGTA